LLDFFQRYRTVIRVEVNVQFINQYLCISAVELPIEPTIFVNGSR